MQTLHVRRPRTESTPLAAIVPRPSPAGGAEDLAVLVPAAAARDQHAWNALVARYSPMIRSVARRHRLCDADQDEVVQQTWIRLLGAIDRITEPLALAGWLSTTARRECLRILGATRREIPVEAPACEDQRAGTQQEEEVEAERREAFHGALNRLNTRQRLLVRMLMLDPPLSYEEVSARLDIPIGSIGPTRSRCLDRLGRDERLAALGAVA